jgi:hypothetical protein
MRRILLLASTILLPFADVRMFLLLFFFSCKPPVIAVVLKVHMHCEACAQGIRKRILKMKGRCSTAIIFILFLVWSFSCICTHIISTTLHTSTCPVLE